VAVAAAVGWSGWAGRSADGVAWNGTDPTASAVSANGLTDNYGQFTNECVVTNTQQGEFGTGTYLGNGWVLTALHVVSGSTYGVTVPGTSIQVNVYGTNYAVDNFYGWGSSDIQLIHLSGYTSGTAANLTGVERGQIYTGSSENGRLMQLGGFGVHDVLNSGTDVNNETFHRGFNLGVASGGVVTTYANGSSRLVQDGYLLGYQQGGDSGSGLWMDNGADQDLDLRDWSLIGECVNGTTPGYFGNSGQYARVSSYQAGIISTVFAHSWLSWNANAAGTSTATDGSGTWDLTSTNFTDGTNYAFNGPMTTQQVTFGSANGAAGTVTLGATIPVDQVVFNAAGSGTYTIAGPTAYSLRLAAGAMITTNVDATISANLTGGTSTQYGAVNEVTKAGTGTLTLTGQTNLGTGAFLHDRAGTLLIGAGGSFNVNGGSASVGLYTGETATLTVAGSYTGTGSDFNLGDLGGTGTLNVQGAAAVTVGQLYVGKGSTGGTGAGGTGTVNQTGGTVTAGSFVSLGTLNAASVGTYNLTAGVLQTPAVTRGVGTGTFNFNGGTLRATASTATFMQGLSAATVGVNGALIDSNGYAATIAQPLAHTGGTTDGGLTKLGIGTLTLTGSSSFTGPTLVSAGTLSLAGAGSIGATAGVSVNGAGAEFLQLSSVAVASPVAITTGSVDGVGTINSVTVADGTGGTVTNGNGVAGVLSMGTLTFAGVGTDLVRITGGSSFASPGQVVGTLNVPAGAGAVTVDVAGPSFTTGTYDLLQFATLNGGGLASFALGSANTGLGHNQAGVLGISGSYLTLTVGGYVDQYTAATDTTWSTATTAAPHDFQASTSPSVKVDYVDTDAVLFDDTPGSGAHAVNLGSAVNPALMTFNNSAASYTISSSGGYGIGGTGALVKNGTGSLTLNTSNSYAGGTTVNAGTLIAGSATALGTGGLKLAGATFGNTAATTVAGGLAVSGTDVVGVPGNSGDLTINGGLSGPGTLSNYVGSAINYNVNLLGDLSGFTGTLNYTCDANAATGWWRVGANNATADLSNAAVVINKGTVTNLATAFSKNFGFANGISGSTLMIGALSGTGVLQASYTGGANALVVGALNTSTTFSGVIAGGNSGTNLSLAKVGAGTLTLSGTNLYTGGTTITAGTLQIGADANLGGAAGGVTLNGGTLRTTNTSAMTFARVYTVGNSGGAIAIAGSGTATTGQGDRLISNTANTLVGSGNLTVTGGGTLAGAAPNTTTAGAGALVLNAGNTYSGTLTLQNGGMVENAGSGALGTATVVLGNEGEIASSNANPVTNAVTVTGGTDSVLSFTNSAGTFSGPVTLSATATVGLRNWYNYATAQSGTISGIVSGTGGLAVNSGTTAGGVLTLSGLNTFTGNLTIGNATVAAGTFIYGTPATSIPSNLGDLAAAGRTITVNGGGVLSLTSGNVLGTGGSTNTLSGLSLVVNAGGVVQTGSANTSNGYWNKFGNVTLNGGTIHVGTGANNTSYQGAALIGSVTVGGTTASTIDTYAGADATANGIHLGQNGTAGQTVTFTVADATGDSRVDLAVTPGLLNTSASLASSGLVKAGAGTMSVAGSSSYGGGTTVNAGTLLANNGTASLGTGTTTVNTSAALAGTGATGGPVRLNGGTITAGTGATGASTIGTLTATTQTWTSGALVDKVSSTSSGAGVGNDLLVLTGLTLPNPATFPITLLATTGSSPAFTAQDPAATATPAAGSYLVLAHDTEGSATNPFASSSVVASLNLKFANGGVNTYAVGDAVQLVGMTDAAGGYDLIAEDVAATPEPAGLLLAGLAAVPLAVARRRRRASQVASFATDGRVDRSAPVRAFG
jgi:autotransporter-associated beta strand protein